MKISIEKLAYFFLIFAGCLLTTQACLVFVFYLPSYIQFLYLFLIFGGVTCLFLPYKNLVSYSNLTFITICILLLIINLISAVLNYEILASYGDSIKYFLRIYLDFWDSAGGRLFGWGLMRPIFYFLYACILFIFLRFKNSTKVLMRSLIIVGIISCIYSIYQIIAFYLGLPYGAIFSGHDNQEITLYGILRRTEGIFFEAGPHATFLSPLFCIMLFQLFENNENKLFFNKKLSVCIFILFTIIMLNTYSPIGYLTPVIAIPIAIILNINKIKEIKITKKIFNRIIVLIILAAMIIASFSVFLAKTYSIDLSLISGYILEKVMVSTSSTDTVSTAGGLGVPEYMNLDARSTRNYAAIEMFKEHPIIGVGPGGAISYFPKFLPFTYARNYIRDSQAVINTHLKILCESGILGFIVYLTMMLYPFWLYIKNYKKLKDNKLFIDSLIIAHFLYLLLSFQSNFLLYSTNFWLIYVPLVASMDKLKSKRKVNY